MSVDRESTKTWSEIAKNIMQVIGVIVAAYWTLFIYGQKEKPSLEPRAKVTYDLKWESTGRADECKAHFGVDIENSGATSFDISKVQVRIWSFERAQQKSDNPIYFDLSEVQRAGKLRFEKIYEKSDGSIPFIRHYPPQYIAGHSFEWIIKRVSNEWMFFRVDFYKSNEEGQPEWYAGSWAPDCGG